MLIIQEQKNIMFDLKYATKNNFTQRVLYKEKPNYSFLRKEAADALFKVVEQAEKLGYGVVIFDAYRPYSATVKMWELVQNEDYAANPAKGSGHNRGIAIDLSLFDLKNRNYLNMGTEFDSFTDSAHHDNTSINKPAQENRNLLKKLMTENGFNALKTEWWHYSWPNKNSKFELLDISFKQLKRLNKRK